MVNSELNITDPGTTVFNKQPLLAPKKVALQDVQNNNRNDLTRDNHPQSLLPVEGESIVDVTKTCGLKRVTPDYSSHRKYEFEGNPRRNPGSTEKVVGHPRSANSPQVQQEVGQINGQNLHNGSLVAPNHMASKTSVSRCKDSHDDEQRTERFIRLHNIIEQCDGSNNRENIQLLQRLSLPELNRHAVKLEKRAILLTLEEGYEMQRMQMLNILGKPSTTKNPMATTQNIQHHN